MSRPVPPPGPAYKYDDTKDPTVLRSNPGGTGSGGVEKPDATGALPERPSTSMTPFSITRAVTGESVRIRTTDGDRVPGVEAALDIFFRYVPTVPPVAVPAAAPPPAAAPRAVGSAARLDGGPRDNGRSQGGTGES